MPPTVVRLPGVVLTDHVIDVPLDHDDPGGERIQVLAREAVAAGREKDDLPWLLYLQGGPGFGAARPQGTDGWLGRALKDYRVLLLDQRGTGRSTPLNRQTLAALGGPDAQAGYLARFRADSIVRDAEFIRRKLLGPSGGWSLLGQSFGGFCTLTYLSYAPQHLRECFVTGGLPGLASTAEHVYRAAYPRVALKNERHYARYPQDRETAARIAAHLREHDVALPDGRRLTVEAFQSLGIMLGSGSGSHQLHWLLEGAWVRGARGPELADGFLAEVQYKLGYAGNPLYAVLHEAIYAQRSVSGEPTAWAAQRVRAEFPEFDPNADQLYFTGEMIYPWMFDSDPVLKPLRQAAHLLAERIDWPDLYDPKRLAANRVPVYAAVYHDDMYVDRQDSLATADAVPGVRTWVTNEWEHDALRVSQGAVLDRLIGMSRGEI
ncbi:Proline iminopeptidase [Streptomyces sp. RB5]|uniref:Proline iminopeptidase n=1 Tax=Streptomyces smaragdinus TaxID=2585196 RepID=A0A7K0CFP9_9ACTN|nr:alpha/beta fold hydrolase [Streptomyces smaragdinus]MQY12301.1 Proline iminopeptidase [Streptomyces smaragdinus]